MAIRVCPECGSQYVASVRRCIDCDVALVEEGEGAAAKSPSAASSSPLGEGDQVGYELEGWGNQLKQTLEGMLDRADVRHVWEASALVVAAEHEAVVDELVATVEGADLPELDDDTPQIAFEMAGIGPDVLVDLDARLIAAGLAYAWAEDGALLVAEADEDKAEAIIQEILDEPEAPEVDGLVTQQALSRLFVAVDKLLKDPTDDKLARRYTEAGESTADLPVPYGMTGIEWDDLHDQVRALAELVPVPKADAHDEVDDAGPTESGSDVKAADDHDDEAAKGDANDANGDGDGGGGDHDDGDRSGANRSGANQSDVDQGDVDDGDVVGAPEQTSRLEQARDLTSQLRERLVDLV